MKIKNIFILTGCVVLSFAVSCQAMNRKKRKIPEQGNKITRYFFPVKNTSEITQENSSTSLSQPPLLMHQGEIPPPFFPKIHILRNQTIQ